MRHRSRLAFGVLAIALAVFLSAIVSAQSASSPATGGGNRTTTWNPPRTPDGRPDLQGIWRNNDATPLERPKEFAGREFLTDDEVAELKTRTDRLFRSGINSDFAGGDNFFFAALANPG